MNLLACYMFTVLFYQISFLQHQSLQTLVFLLKLKRYRCLQYLVIRKLMQIQLCENLFHDTSLTIQNKVAVPHQIISTKPTYRINETAYNNRNPLP